MSLFKVTMRLEIKKTFVAYVDAPNKEAADEWASMVQDEEAVGRCVDTDDYWGSVEEIEEAYNIPDGYRANTVAETAT